MVAIEVGGHEERRALEKEVKAGAFPPFSSLLNFNLHYELLMHCNIQFTRYS